MCALFKLSQRSYANSVNRNNNRVVFPSEGVKGVLVEESEFQRWLILSCTVHFQPLKSRVRARFSDRIVFYEVMASNEKILKPVLDPLILFFFTYKDLVFDVHFDSEGKIIPDSSKSISDKVHQVHGEIHC